ncbi:MAG: class I SAM-dependent methyltransferase [Myxococcales bacterium]|nr:class I SAM-dependent methyltransferase [Myxococcales bacterium]
MSTFTYQGRYPVLASRRGVWQEVAGWIDRRFGPFDSAVELGAGYCDFINSLPARHKRALDINPEMAHHAGPGVEFICGDVTTKWPIAPSSADLVFASNFLEHIPVFAGATLLREVKEALRPGGRLVLLQPNFRRCAAHYFDDETHVAVYSDDTLTQAVIDAGFVIEHVDPGFLPFSMKSRLPKWRGLVRLYLNSPVKPGAAQMLIVGRRP